MRTATVICLFLVTVFPAGTLRADTPAAKIGDVVPELRFKDIRYASHSLRDFSDKRAIVLISTNTTCPLVQKYWPKLNRLSGEYREQGVQFVAMNVAPDDAIAEMAQQGIDFSVTFPFVKDCDGSCVQALGFQRTPEVVVLDASRRLRYRGRIDDQHRTGGSRPSVSTDDLKQALDEVLAGRDVTTAESPVDGCLITLPTFTPPKEPVTFYEHIAPLLQQHCQECHHAGGSAPFSLMTFDEAASHAETIAEVVRDQSMPPWYGSRRHKFANERGLSSSERRKIIAWVKTGAAPGDESKAPPPRVFVDAIWEIGEPDLITRALETHDIPAEGVIDYKYVILPHVFLQDTWISGAEILPSNPAVVHHCNMAHITIGEKFDNGNFITGRVPGGTAMVLDDGIAYRIPKGSVIALQIHYTTTGKPEKNRMSVGFRFPRTVVHKELQHVQANTSRFAIPPGAEAHPVSSSRTLPCDASGIGMFSHMHLRGKDMIFTAHYPSGEKEVLLTIPNYNYAWQQNYRWEPGTKKFPKGTRIEVVGHYDNSAFNPFNPDPTSTVKYGAQTFDEMLFGFFFYTDDAEDLNLRVDPKTGRAASSPTPRQ
jgi:thiol-disulfide isomerase/thioredoxin